MLRLLIWSILFSQSVHAATSWGAEEVRLYNRRDFIRLEHLMVTESHGDKLALMRKQEGDLSGCRSLNHGIGGIGATIQCMSFLARERSMGLKSPGSATLVKDINILCGKLAAETGSLEKMLASSVLSQAPNLWLSCSRSFWKQLYLTAYANFDADPVRTLVLVRKAENAFPRQEPWVTKVESLIKTN